MNVAYDVCDATPALGAGGPLHTRSSGLHCFELEYRVRRVFAGYSHAGPTTQRSLLDRFCVAHQIVHPNVLRVHDLA